MRNLLTEFDDYLRFNERCTPATVKRFCLVATQLASYLSSALGDPNERLVAATESEVVAFLRLAAETRKGSFSPFMWNQKLTALRALFRYVVKQKLRPENPTAELSRVTAIARERIPLSLPEFVALIRAFGEASEPHRSRNIAFTHVGFHCGLRLSELSRLDLDHLDRTHRLIVNLIVKGGKFLMVPVPQVAIDAIDRYLEQRPRFHPGPTENALFLSERGRRISTRQIGALIPAAAKRAGILRRISPHFLRHSVATAHARRGTQPWDVQRLLGHSSLATTELYIHTLDSLVAAVDSLGAEVETMLTDGKLNTNSASASAVVRSGLIPPAGFIPPNWPGVDHSAELRT